jgi:hypothetical protein
MKCDLIILIARVRSKCIDARLGGLVLFYYL